MKLLGKYFLVMASMLIAYSSNAREEHASGGNDKNEHVVILKADRKFIGATVEVMNANGGKVVTHKLMRRKIVVDFGLVHPGEYIILIKKENNMQEHRYVKR